MQGLFRNPMASPEILGVSAGGSLGAVIAITSGISEVSLLVLPASTIGGAFLAATLIYFMSSFRGSTSLLSSSSRDGDLLVLQWDHSVLLLFAPRA